MVSDSPGTSGPQRADPAHEQLHRHALLRGEVERVDGGLVDDGVGLEADPRRPAGTVVGDLLVDPGHQPVAHRVGRDQQRVVRRLAAVAAEVVEQVGDVLADGLVGGDQPEVLVGPGRLGVVVARADVGVAADAVGLVADHHRELAVGLQPDLAVDDVAAGLLELAGPADVGRLVEARLDLDQRQHLLARLGGVDEGVDDRGVAGRAVERLLDGQHVRVGGGLLEEALHGRRERVVRVVQQYVVPTGRLEHVDRRRRLDVGQLAVGDRHEGGVLEVLAGEVGDVVQPAQVERTGHADDLLRRDAELGDQQVEHLRGDRLLDLEPHGRAEPPAQQLLLQCLEQVLGVVLLDLEILVAGDPEGVELQHLHAGEQPLEVLADDVLERHEALVAEGDEAAERGRHLDPCEVLLAGLGVADQHGHVQREPGDVGERVSRVDGERREDREDALLEEPLAELLLLAVEVVPPHQVDPVGRQRRHQVVAEELRVPLALLGGAGPDRLEHVARHQPGRRPNRHAGRDPALEAGHADHEELVEVAGEERHRPHPLEQRQVVVLGQLEQPQVEAQPRQLAVEEPVVVLRQVLQRLGIGHVRRLDVEGLVHGGEVGHRIVGGAARGPGDRSRRGHGSQCGTAR